MLIRWLATGANWVIVKPNETCQRIPIGRELVVAPGLGLGRPTRRATRRCSPRRASVVGSAREEQQRLSARLDALCERGHVSTRKTDRASLRRFLTHCLRGGSGRDEIHGNSGQPDKGRH